MYFEDAVKIEYKVTQISQTYVLKYCPIRQQHKFHEKRTKVASDIIDIKSCSFFADWGQANSITCSNIKGSNFSKI